MASSLWGGGLFALSIAILPAVFRLPTRRRQCIATIAQRFSILAGVTLAEVLLTGLYNAWAQLGMIRALWEVSYGRMLLVKLLLVIPLVAFGASNHYKRSTLATMVSTSCSKARAMAHLGGHSTPRHRSRSAASGPAHPSICSEGKGRSHSRRGDPDLHSPSAAWGTRSPCHAPRAHPDASACTIESGGQADGSGIISVDPFPRIG